MLPAIRKALVSKTFKEAALKAKMTAAMGDKIRVWMLFTYRDASDRDLSDYLALYETPPFRQFERTFRRGFMNAVRQQSREPAKDLRRLAARRIYSRIGTRE